MIVIKYDQESKDEYEKYVKSGGSVLITYNSPFENSKKVITCSIYDPRNTFDDLIIGFGMANIYNKGDLIRCDQWQFGDNKHRELWIDLLYSKNNTGKKILCCLEEQLLKFSKVNELERRNIYTMALGKANGFYHSCGYEEILMLDTDEDEDEPEAYMNGRDLKCLMAKSIGMDKPLDSEELDVPKIDSWSFSNCIQRNRSDLLNRIFSSITTSYKDMLYFEKINTLTLEKIENANIDDNLKNFFRDLLVYKVSSEKDYHLSKYFSIEKSQKCVNNYLDGYCH